MLQEKRRETTMRLISEKIKTFNRVEKAFYASLVFTALVLAIGVIFIQTKLLQVQGEMARVNQQINSKQVEIDDTKQAIQELTRSGRLMEIAEKEGLTLNNNNIGVAE
ncbi:cell division protein FtsL [Streptococcus suis]